MPNAIKIVLLCLTLTLAGCSTMQLDIKTPSHGAAVGAGYINLLTVIQLSDPQKAPATCPTVDWRVRIDNRTICSGTGPQGNGRYTWCSPETLPPCTLIWRNIPTTDIGSGAHSIEIKADVEGQQGGDSITINVP